MSNGQVVCKLDDDSRPFGFYSVENGDTIHIVDTNPHSLSAGGGLEDTSLVKKYVMSDEEYNKRKNTLRAYKREQMKQDPNFKFDFNKGKKAGAGGPGGLAAVAEKENMYGAESVEGITVGSRCQVQPGLHLQAAGQEDGPRCQWGQCVTLLPYVDRVAEPDSKAANPG